MAGLFGHGWCDAVSTKVGAIIKWVAVPEIPLRSGGSSLRIRETIPICVVAAIPAVVENAVPVGRYLVQNHPCDFPRMRAQRAQRLDDRLPFGPRPFDHHDGAVCALDKRHAAGARQD